MSLVEGGLRGLVKKSRRRSGKIRVLQFELGARIERDRTQSLCARPAVCSSRRNRLIERPQRRSRWNLVQNLRGISVGGFQLAQTQHCGVPKIRLRKSLDVFSE